MRLAADNVFNSGQSGQLAPQPSPESVILTKKPQNITNVTNSKLIEELNLNILLVEFPKTTVVAYNILLYKN